MNAKDEIAWLVERPCKNGFEYLCVYYCAAPGKVWGWGWTRDALKALRFTRESDADSAIKMLFQRFPVQQVKSVQHEFAALRAFDAGGEEKRTCGT